MFNTSLKTALLRSTILVGAAAFTVPAMAQVAVPAGTGTQVATAEAPDNAQEIIVTGSLIKNPNLIRSSPVTVTTSEEIELKQSNVAEEVLREIPGVVPSIGSAVNNGNGGASYVDLRGLGSNRNVVLLDGNRLVPSGLVGRVDLNNIPLALVERVESLTGGASTTYGADAVSGVVNFITKQNFTGIDMSVSEQITEKGDGNVFRSDVTIGGNFADDKGNAVVSVGYQKADAVFQSGRDYGYNNIDSFSGAVGGGSTTTSPSVFSFAGGGRDATDPLRLTGNRQIDPALGAVRTPPAAGVYSPFNFNPYNLYQTPFKRFNIFAQAKYDISDNIEVYTRGLFSRNTVSTIIAPSGVFASDVTIPLSNPYLPAALRTQFCNNNDFDPLTPGIQTVSAAQCAAGALATNPTDPNYKTFTTQLRRRSVEGGVRQSEYRTTVFDYRLGVRGSLSDSIDYDVAGAYGESENRQDITGYVYTSRARAALLATNTKTCLNDPTGTCVPLNIFGPTGSITPAMLAYVASPATSAVRTQLGQIHGTISGNFGFASPGASDPISFAVGGEYRNYKASQSADVAAATAGELGGAGGATPIFSGGYNVSEGFGELVAPLIQDKPFFQNLTLEAGVRYSHYEIDGGPSNNTTTYKGGASWEPVSGVKFRGNYSHAVRAPNIAELFTPNTTGLTNLTTDPCALAAPTRNAELRSICLAQGAPAFSIGSIPNPASGQPNATSGGNLNLRPEKANTYTLGAVLQPTFLTGFSVTADYYNIKVSNAISTPTTGDAIAACFGADVANPAVGSSTSAACTAIRRNPTTGALDGDAATTPGLSLPLSNLGTIKTDGLDVTANYSRDVGIAKLGLSFTGNYTFHSKFQATPTSLNRECVGFYSTNCAADGGTTPGSIQPKFQWSQRTTFGFDTFDVSLLWRHIDKVRQEPDDILNGNGPAYQGTVAGFGTQDFQHIKSFDYFDLTGRVSVLENLTLTLTVQNLTDKKPPLTGTLVGSTSFNNGNTYPSTYDALGRRYAMTARVRF